MNLAVHTPVEPCMQISESSSHLEASTSLADASVHSMQTSNNFQALRITPHLHGELPPGICLQGFDIASSLQSMIVQTCVFLSVLYVTHLPSCCL